MQNKKAFTLIELLIVVAIIAILAAIAVPNFLEAQVRSKVSRGKTDMRSLATAIEAYRVDLNKYPPDLQHYQWYAGMDHRFAECPLGRLTTPVAYITALPNDPFPRKGGTGDGLRYAYNAETSWRKIGTEGFSGALQTQAWPLLWDEAGSKDAEMTKLWALTSLGPDLASNGGSYYMFGEKVLNRVKADKEGWSRDGALYDATNGTISQGDIVRVGP